MTDQSSTRPPEGGQPFDGHPPSWRSRLRRRLLAGLVVLVPVALTAWVLYQLFELMDGLFAPLLAQAVGRHVPGLGLLLTVAVVLVLGWLSANVLGRRLIHTAEQVFYRIPVGRTIYAASKSVLQVLSERQADAFKRVVLIEYPRPGIYSLAFVTSRVAWPQIHEALADARMVFLPTTPNPTSGFLLIVPRDQIVDLPMAVEEGVRLVISGGILSPKLATAAAAPAPPTGHEEGRRR